MKTEILIVAGVAIAIAYVAMRAKNAVSDTVSGAVDAVSDFIPHVNPADSNNFIYSNISKLGEGLGGETGWTLGGAIFDLERSRNEYFGRAVDAVGDVANAVNPWNNSNVFYAGVTDLLGGETLGSKIYDWMN